MLESGGHCSLKQWSVWVGHTAVTGDLSLEEGEGVSCVELSRHGEQPGQSF